MLIAPLDWGLGHATRCIPIIKTFQQHGYKVTIAAHGKTLTLLKTEFPGIKTIELFGYNIQYANKKRLLPLKILLQAPKIVLTIIKEHTWLKKIIHNERFDLVISDNRFGLYTNKTPCIFITHQLLIKAPFKWLENLIQKINYRFINKFTACWVPDFATGSTLAGLLSHPKKMPNVPVKYIGPISRFISMQNHPLKYNWLVILSGPEPQRTIFENKIFAVVQKLPGTKLLVRGKPGEKGQTKAPENFTVVNHLPTVDMQRAFEESDFVISRCGYTTVMEVLGLQKKAILIPTPGQTEQEYLAKHLLQQKWCYSCLQDDDLLYEFTNALSFNYQKPLFNTSTLPTAVLEISKA